MTMYETLYIHEEKYIKYHLYLNVLLLFNNYSLKQIAFYL